MNEKDVDYSRMDHLMSTVNINQKNYLDKCCFKVDLNLIYSVEASSYDNQNFEYCPVLLKLGKKANFPGLPANTKHNYLLQLWNKEGHLVYEYQTQTAISHMVVGQVKNGSIRNAKKDARIFVFLEAHTLHALLINPGEEIQSFAFQRGHEAETLKFPETAFMDAISHIGMCNGHLILADNSTVQYFNLFGLLDLCIREKTRVNQNYDDTAREQTGFHFHKFEMRESEKLKNYRHLSVRGIETLDKGEGILILEEMDNHYLVFMLIEIIPFQGGQEHDLLKLTLIESIFDVENFYPDTDENPGCQINPIERQIEALKRAKKPIKQNENREGDLKPLRHMQHVVQKAKDQHNPDQQNMHFAVALREDGTLDFYCNFIRVSTFDNIDYKEQYLENEGKKEGGDGYKDTKSERVTRVELDFTRIYFETETGGAGGVKKLHICDLENQRLIGEDTCKEKKVDLQSSPSDQAFVRDKHQRLLEEAIERRIASHFRPYSNFLCNKNYFFISHRNFVSTYDLNTGDFTHIEFRDTVTNMLMMQPSQKINSEALVYSEFGDKQVNFFKTDPQDADDSDEVPQDLAQTGRAGRGVSFNKQKKKQRGAGRPDLTYLVVVEGYCTLAFLEIDSQKPVEDKPAHPHIRIPVFPIVKLQYDEAAATRRLVILMRKPQSPVEYRAHSPPPKDEYPLKYRICREQEALHDQGTKAYVFNEDERNSVKQGVCQLLVFDGSNFITLGNDDLRQINCETNIHYRTSQYKKEENEDGPIAPIFKKQLEVSIQTFPTDKLEAAETNLYIIREIRQFYSSITGGAQMNLPLKDPIVLSRDDDPEPEAHRSRMLNTFTVADAGAQSKAEFIVEVREDCIHIYKNKVSYFTLTGIKVSAVMFWDSRYIYALQDATRGQVQNPSRTMFGQEDPADADQQFKTAGVFIYDLLDILKTKNVQRIKLSDSLSQVNNQLFYNYATGRISFLSSYGKLLSMPPVHRNSNRFIGMEDKKTYKIWLECDGEFTALSDDGDMRTWSTITGMQVKDLKQSPWKDRTRGPTYQETIAREYEVYQQGRTDNTYTEGDFNMLNDGVGGPVSYSLLIQKDLKDGKDKELKLASLDCFFKRNTDDLDKGIEPAYDTINVAESSQKVDSRNFKVLQLLKNNSNECIYCGQRFEDPVKLQQHEAHEDGQGQCDKGRKMPKKFRHKCTEKFSFNFDLYEDDNKKGEFDYSNPCYPAQSIYLSQDTTKLLEIVFEKGMAKVWKRDEHLPAAPAQGYLGPLVEFRPYRNVPVYPQLMDLGSEKNTLFDPNFQWMLNICFLTDEFFIWDVDQQHRCDSAEATVKRRLPRDFLTASTNPGEQAISKQSIKKMAARMQLLVNGNIRILNVDDCDCIIDPTKWEPETDQNGNTDYTFEGGLLSCVKVDNLTTKANPKHYFLDPPILPRNDVTARLIRMSQRWKSWLENAPQLYEAKQLKMTKQTIFEALYSVDYSDPWDANDSAFFTQQSFTVYDWILSDKIIKGNNGEFNIAKMASNARGRLAFNVFPGGQTVLHKIAKLMEKDQSQSAEDITIDQKKDKRTCCKKIVNWGERQLDQPSINKRSKRMKNRKKDEIFETDIVDAVASNQHMITIMSGLFDALQNMDEAFMTEHYMLGKTTLEMPITRDIYGESGLDTVLGVNVNKSRFPIDFFLSQEQQPNRQCLSAAFASEIFSSIKTYGFMHSGYTIAGAIPKAIENDVPGIFQFLDARFKKPKHCPDDMNSEIKENKQEVGWITQNTDDGLQTDQITYAAQPFSPWVKHTTLEKAFFQQDQAAGAGGKPLKSYNLNFYDIPYLHQYSTEGIAFMDALYDHPSDEALDTVVITMIVRHRWALAQRFYRRTQQWPYFFTIVVNTIWILWIAPNKGANHAFIVGNYICCVIMIAYTCWALVIEGIQVAIGVKKQSFGSGLYAHFSDYQNVLELLTIVNLGLISCVALVQGNTAMPVWFWGLASVTTVIVWLKLILFFRAWDGFSFFVLMFLRILEDIVPFLKVLFVIVFAFASAFNFHSIFIHSYQVIEEAERVKATCPDLIDGSKPVDALGQACVQESVKEITMYLDSFSKSVVFSWLLTLGEFNLDNNEGSVVGWALFVVASLLSQVVMLNLLVAIFSATHDEVTDTMSKVTIKAIVDLIWDTQSIQNVFEPLPSNTKEGMGKLLFYVREASPEPTPLTAEQVANEAQEDIYDAQIENIDTNVKDLNVEFERYRLANKETALMIKRAAVNVAGRANKHFNPQ